MKNRKKVSVIIPAYNEEKIIKQTLDNLKFNWIKEIIVVNDGSTDNTGEIIANYPVNLINLDKNLGKGKAVDKTIDDIKGEVILLVDADLGESVIEAKRLVKPILLGEVDITIGVLPVKGGGLGLVRWLAKTGLNVIGGQKMKAPLSGQRAFTREVLNLLLPLSTGFGLEIGMDIDIMKKGLNYREVECNFKHTVTGQTWNGYLHRGEQFLSILKTLFIKGFDLL